MSVDKVKGEINADLDTDVGPWDSLIAQAKEQRRQAKASILKLSKSIVFFERKKRAGEPWPGSTHN